MLEPAPDWRLRARYGGLLGAYWAGGYFTAQAHATVAFDSTLPVDAMLPFVGAAVWLYLAGIAWIVAPLFLLPTRAALRMAARGYALALTVSILFFYLLQTSAPALRAHVPAAATGDLSVSMLRLLHSVDGPGNLVPSLYVGLSWLAAEALTRADPRWKVPSLLIALAVSVSVVLCKQHTVVDVVAGLALAALCRQDGPYAEFLAGPMAPRPRPRR